MMGAFSALVAAGIFLFVKEPTRGRFLTEKEKNDQQEKVRKEAEQKEADRLAGKKPENPIIGIVKNIAKVA